MSIKTPIGHSCVSHPHIPCAGCEPAKMQNMLTAALAEIERLKKNVGCARNQGSTQYCQEAVTATQELDAAREALRETIERLGTIACTHPQFDMSDIPRWRKALGDERKDT